MLPLNSALASAVHVVGVDTVNGIEETDALVFISGALRLAGFKIHEATYKAAFASAVGVREDFSGDLPDDDDELFPKWIPGMVFLCWWWGIHCIWIHPMVCLVVST